MKSRLMLLFGAGVLVLAACSSGGSDSGVASADLESPDTTLQDTATPSAGVPDDSTTDDSPPVADADEGPLPETVAGGASATLTLENGESFTFGILCALEPQEAAGQEILFTVASFDRPYYLDVTQFGIQSLGGAANITLYDADTLDTVWEANTFFGGEVTLEQNGNTITGRGVFLEGDDGSGPGVAGELEANC